MAESGRVRRIAERIRISVATTLERKVKDPRIGFVTITDVRVTGDLQHATIYYTVLGEEEDRKATRRALESAKGLVRSEVGAALGIRLTPTISFQLDSLPESAASIEEALRSANKRDAEIAEAARGKQYAGDESPYREWGTEGIPDAAAADEADEVIDDILLSEDENLKDTEDLDDAGRDATTDPDATGDTDDTDSTTSENEAAK